MSKRPQTRDEMVATLLRRIRAASVYGGREATEPSAETVKYCQRIVDEYLVQRHHPIWLNHGIWWDVMSHDRIQALMAELADTPYANVWPSERPWLELRFWFHETPGDPWFPDVEMPDAGMPAGVVKTTVTATGELRRANHVPEAGRTLDWFARRFHGETRERIRAAAADLRKDVRDLRAEGASRWHVRWECLATTATTLGPIILDRVARIVRAVMSVVREFDGPRPG